MRTPVIRTKMLQPREGAADADANAATASPWRRITTVTTRIDKRNVALIKNLKILHTFFLLLMILPSGLTQNYGESFVVQPTPTLEFRDEDLTTVVLVNNDNGRNNDHHGRFLQLRPEVGLLTSTARTFIQEGTTTEYATQVVGTTLDNGRLYAQYLKKSSRVLFDSERSPHVSPSVVTSWIGESSLQTKSSPLLQSHNDLFNDERSNWHDVDDRLLTAKNSFVGNIDFVDSLGILEKKDKAALVVTSSSTTSTSSSSSSSSDASAPIRVVPLQIENLPRLTTNGDARKLAANKVLPIADLPTYTVKNQFAPSNYFIDGQSMDVDNANGNANAGRSAKLFYQKIMQSDYAVGTKVAQQQPQLPPNRLIPSRVLATTTYYGFADFTTTVGDSVIVFTPSTTIANLNVGQVTSIMGEATLGDSIVQTLVPDVTVSVTRDAIEPSLTETVATAVWKGDREDVTVSESESKLLATTSTISEPPTADISHSQTVQPVMLSRPSENEILSLFSSISNAEAAKKPATTATATTEVEPTIASIQPSMEISASASASASPSSSVTSVEMHGGATTIFFEDDPFENFVEPTESIKLPETLATYSAPTATTPSTTHQATIKIVEETTEIAKATTPIVQEIVGESEEPKPEPKDESDDATATTTATTHEMDTTTTPVITTEKAEEQNKTTTTSTIKDSLVVKEIRPDTDVNSENCLRTSQVFLTQIPKTLLVSSTHYIEDGHGETTISIESNVISTTYDITQATKHYCIEATATAMAVSSSSITKSPLEREIEKSTETTSTTENVTISQDDGEGDDEDENDREATTLAPADQELEYGEDSALIDAEDDADDENGSDEEEIDLVYKTLYTTYTYLTTFFQEETTSISSHTEVVTNVITSTLGMPHEILPSSASASSIDVSPTKTTAEAIESQTSTRRYILPTELESIIRDSETQRAENENESKAAETTEPILILSLDDSKITKTLYTTYTYYTSIFADGETEIMSRTEVYTNLITEPSNTVDAAVDIAATPASSILTDDKTLEATNQFDLDRKPSSSVQLNYSTMTRSSAAASDDYDSSVTLVMGIVSSSSNGEHHIINHPPMARNNNNNDQLEDQISSESNTDEIIPSATLLLQTSFTTFTYYTTMYSGENTNVISRLETVTNVVTETLQATKINTDETELPITYFTTFTYWTKLAKDGEVTTLSREETISNVVTPTPTPVLSLPTAMATATSSSSTEQLMSTDGQLQNENSNSMADGDDSSSSASDASVVIPSLINRAEPTTYYTTYTYYTTSYDVDKTITDSRFETITNVVTPSVVVALNDTAGGGYGAVATPAIVSQVTPPPPLMTKAKFYDFKKIIDADGISTLYFTTEIFPTIDADGTPSEIFSTSSSLYVDEVKRALLPTAATSLAVIIDGTATRQHKTGLVRLIEGTRIGNDTTTLYQSKVIGTIIDNRYAQIIESTSSFLFRSADASTISPSATESIVGSTQRPLSAVRPDVIESSISDGDGGEEQTTQANSDYDHDGDGDENNDSDDGKGGGGLSQLSKKRTFTPVIRPFASRNRPQFAPKKKNVAPSSATIITRTDFTPTITATPALKSSGRFSSLRKGSIYSSPLSPSNSGGFGSPGSTSSRRFGRPSKSSGGIGSPSPTVNNSFLSSSRSRLSSSRISPQSSSRRASSFARPSSPGGFRPGLSSAYAGNSRLRIKPTPLFNAGQQSTLTEANATPPSPDDGDNEDENSTPEQTNDDEGESATESSRRNQNPLLRLRRPLNRPSGFTPVPRSNAGNNNVSPRRNPLSGRTKATTTTTTTTTTPRPRPRSFQRPGLVNLQSRSRPQNSLFPPRSLFPGQKPAVVPNANVEDKDKPTKLNDDDNNDPGNDDDSEYDDDDDGELNDDTEENDNRRRRSNSKTKTKNSATTAKKLLHRSRREADTSLQTRANFRNRFRRPKTAAVTVDDRNYDEYAEYDSVPSTTTTTSPPSRSRVSSRFGSRYQSHSTHQTTAASSSTPAIHRGIRPTRPTTSRAQFTLREKDLPSTSLSSKNSGRSGVSNFRRPQTSASSRRTTASGGTTSRRLKNYAASNVASDNLPRTSNSRIRNSNIGSTGRGRGSSRNRNRNDFVDPSLPNSDGTITVTHVQPSEVTLPVVNGKVTEYKNVVTAKSITEVLSPQQYTTVTAPNGQTIIALAREESSINFAGATEITKFILHESLTTTVTFTPTTIRGRKTSFSHVIPSTVYSVEQVVSTHQPQISANAPLANILLSQLLLGNLGLPANPLLGALGPAGSSVPLQTAMGQAAGPAPLAAADPITEYRTHTSTYVTTVFEGMSTVLPVTFQGKKILTTVYDTTAQTITATEFITDTIITTPTQPAPSIQAQAQVNTLLLQQLLQQQLQQQPQIADTPQSPIFHTPAPQLLIAENHLQDLQDNPNPLHISNSNDVIDYVPILSESTPHKSGRKKNRKTGKNHNRNKHIESPPAEESTSSVVTLYVSGRRPGEFSTILSTVIQPNYESSSSSLHKREADINDASAAAAMADFYDSDGSELMTTYLAPDEFNVMPIADNSIDGTINQSNEQTESLESIVGDVSLWYRKVTATVDSAEATQKYLQTNAVMSSAFETPTNNPHHPHNGREHFLA